MSSRVEGYDRPRSENCLASFQFGHVGMCDGQGPQKPGEPFDIATLLEGFTYGSDLCGGEGERRERQQRRRGRQLDGVDGEAGRRVGAGRGLGGAVGRGPAVRLQDARVQRRRRGLVPGAAHRCECARRSRARCEPEPAGGRGRAGAARAIGYRLRCAGRVGQSRAPPAGGRIAFNRAAARIRRARLTRAAGRGPPAPP